MPLTPDERVRLHLEGAQAAGQPLQVERAVEEAQTFWREKLAAGQGVALRTALYHCTAAIVAAIERARG